jgi:hypothetical protein
MYNTIAKVLVILGIVVCVVAVAGRFYGESALVLGCQPSNVVLAGVALMVLACYAKLESKG